MALFKQFSSKSVWDDYYDEDAYDLEYEREQENKNLDWHCGNPLRFSILFKNSRIYKLETRSKSLSTGDNLVNQLNGNLILYRIINAILLNDFALLACLLQSTTCLTNPEIEYSELRDIDRSLLNGFLTNRTLKNKFDVFLQSDVKITHCYFEHKEDCDSLEPYSDKTEPTIHIFALACFYNDIRIIELVTSKVGKVSEECFQAIICNKNVNIKTFRYLVNNANLWGFPRDESNPELQMYFRIIQILIYECIGTWNTRELCFEKLKLVLQMIHVYRNDEKERILNAFRHCLELIIVNKDGCVLRFVMDNTPCLLKFENCDIDD